MKKITSILLLALVGLVACKKEVVGPAGPAGPQGPKGQTGNANVINESKDVFTSQWIYDSSYQQWYYLYYPNTTLPYGTAVMVYVISGNGKQAMPYVETVSNWRVTYADNLFKSPPYIELQFTNFTSLTTGPSNTLNFYFVFIPPAAKISGVDYSDPVQVKRAHNLPD